MTISRKVVGIIDDDPAMRGALSALLTAVGYRTEVYASGEEFIEVASKSEAGCLVIDIQLGDLSGVELGRHLLAMGLTFPVIFMSGSVDGVARQQAMELRCIAFLQKPFPPNQLVEAIIEAIG
jgi:FixJ family two-component response regulator